MKEQTANPIPFRYLSSKHICESLDICWPTLQKLESEGLPVEWFGKRLKRYRLDRVLHWMENRGQS